MDILLLGAGLVGVALAAVRWGADSRQGIDETRSDRRDRWTIL